MTSLPTPLPFHVTADSRQVESGSIFFALKGAQHDGHQFIPEAWSRGAKTIYSELETNDPNVICLGNQARRKFAELVSEMLGHPSQKLTIIGITGTSGKTTTATLIQHLLNTAGFKCARIGTTGFAFQNIETPSINTTPDPVTFQTYLRDVSEKGATHVVMEVSSHALVQDRVWGLAWDAVVFLNLSPEHLDFHQNMEDYFNAKSILFKDHIQFSQDSNKIPLAIINHDHEWGNRLLQKVAPQLTRQFSTQTDFSSIQSSPQGVSGKFFSSSDEYSFSCPLLGEFQLENILAALTTLTSLHPEKIQEFTQALSSFPGVPGRMERVSRAPHHPVVLVDYAHKPDALEKVLRSLNSLKSSDSKIITVFGCGGDRDPFKRPEMGKIASELSEQVILTSDNPRTEDPQKIIKDIQTGVHRNNVEVILDRAKAIQKAIELASVKDIVLIAGKGHEPYQIIGKTVNHFDDREVARSLLKSQP